MQKNDHRESPTYWFAVLDIARERGNVEREREAIENLRRLGIRVTFENPKGGDANA